MGKAIHATRCPALSRRTSHYCSLHTPPSIVPAGQNYRNTNYIKEYLVNGGEVSVTLCDMVFFPDAFQIPWVRSTLRIACMRLAQSDNRLI